MSRKTNITTPSAKRRMRTHVTPNGFQYEFGGGGMHPFYMGLAAAEFLPADPAVWVQAAIDARMRFAISGHGNNSTLDFGKIDAFTADGEEDSQKEFLRGWLIGTAGGNVAVCEYMRQHDFAGTGGPN